MSESVFKKILTISGYLDHQEGAKCDCADDKSWQISKIFTNFTDVNLSLSFWNTLKTAKNTCIGSSLIHTGDIASEYLPQMR